MQKLREVERKGKAGNAAQEAKLWGLAQKVRELGRQRQTAWSKAEIRGTCATVAQRASPPQKRSCGDRTGWIGSGHFSEASVDDQQSHEGQVVVLVATSAYSASVFVPQVRAQHGAFALLTVRLKLSVLTNSALTVSARTG